MRVFFSLLAMLSVVLPSIGCNSCDANDATNKMLALNRVQGRWIAKGGDGLTPFALSLATEIGPISELIAQQKYDEACKKADELAAKYKLDLAAEQKGMISVEELAKDGGKGGGSCSIADAAKKQMEIHSLLQAEVTAGRMRSDIFATFNEDTRGYGEMLSTNPSAACELFERLRKKYGLPEKQPEQDRKAQAGIR